MNEFLLRCNGIGTRISLFFIGFLLAFSGWAQTVTTDKEDYVPGEYVIITGTNWLPGERVDFTFEETPKPESCVNSHYIFAIADLNGNIFNDEFLIKENHIGVSFVLTAKADPSGNEAQTTFTDGNVRIDTNSGEVAVSFIKYNSNSCSGTVLNSGSATVNTTTTNTTYQGVGSGESLKLTAPATNNLAQTFQGWTSANGSASFAIVGGNPRVICVQGTQGNGAIKLEISYNTSCIPPAVTAMPASACVGSTITFTGTNFTTGTTNTVAFNGASTTSLAATTTTSLQVIIPDNATTGAITITNGNGCSVTTGSYTVNPKPTVTSLPTASCVGSTITIPGTNFTVGTGNTVTFTGASGVASNVSSTATSLSVTIPANATTGVITITNSNGCAVTTASYTVNPLPTVTIMPATACVGSTITFTGTNFTDGTGNTVTFTGASGVASNVSSTATSLSVTIPTNATTGVITIANGNGCAVTTASYTVNPLISNNSISENQSICPNSAPAELIGSTPSGGNGTYAFSWESSTAGSATGFGSSIGSNKSYSPSSLAQTTWFRRKVNSGGCAQSISNVIEITVDDITDPTASNPAAINVECLADVPAPDAEVVTDEADNCGTATVSFISQTADPLVNDGTITRTYRVDDGNGNTFDVFQDIVIDDITDPTASNPAAINVECLADVPAPDAEVVTDEADNCGTATVSFISQTADPLVNDGTITRTYRVDDGNGNTFDVFQDIVIDDITDPTASNPAAINVECLADVPAPDAEVVTDEADNCGTATVSFISQTADPLVNDGTITRTYRVDDGNGNTFDVFQDIVIDDITDPTASNPAAINVECLADVPAPDAEVVTDEADNCGTATVSFISQTADPLVNDGTITRTYRVDDGNGNTFDVFQDIVIDDITDPTASNPAAINVECLADVPAPDAEVVTDEADNCGTATVSFISQTADPLVNDGTITRTYRVDDGNGNTFDVFQDIVIDDITDPTASNPAAINVECLADVPAPDAEVVTDEADNCGTATVSFISQTADPLVNDGTITRTYRVDDGNGNTFDVFQDIVIDDTQAPTWSTPIGSLNTSVLCGNAGTLSTAQALAPTATDNCSATLTYTKSSGVLIGGPNGTYTNTWTATDASGNVSAVFTQVITLTPVTIDASASSMPVQIGSAATLSATVTPNVAGVLVTFYLNDVEQGTGTYSNGVYELVVSGLGVGVYKVTAVAGNGCASSDVYLPVYDPTGGFVTGGGWIDSPANAMSSGATGKANFGFNAKYKNGKNNMTEVDGNTNFQFKAGDLHFSSIKHNDMELVIAGRKATYTGTGTVNGRGNHKFRVVAIDGDFQNGTGPDKFRIKIWDDGSDSQIYYDNQRGMSEAGEDATVLGGGSIVIHKPKGKAQEDVTKGSPVIMEDLRPEILETLALSPNPVVSFSTVRFSVKEDAMVTLRLFDHSGRMIETLFQGNVKAFENYDVDFQRRNLMSGIYIVKLTTAKGHSYEKRIIIN